MSSYKRLLLPENLNYAWQKAKRLYRSYDGYVDSCEIAEFELNLEFRLNNIRRQFEKGSFRLKKLRPLPRPKKIQDDEPIDRQYFHVSVDDQVAWIAVANTLGPELDRLMPPWSYGYRIYRPAWYEPEEERQSKLEIGPYRHASGHLYRKFQHSWPVFRRHVAHTAKSMIRGKPPDHHELDRANRLAVASAEAENLPYLRANFWRHAETKAKGTDLYHASIDLKRFFPYIQPSAILRGLTSAGSAVDESDPLRMILKDMLRFRINKTDLPNATLERVDPQFGGMRFRGLPTGLFVAGFLANAALLPVDRLVNDRIEKQRSLAHFRYVDDHTLLAYDFDELCDWIDWYQELLVQKNTGAMLNTEKYDPESLGKWMDVRVKSKPNSKSRSRERVKLREIRRSAIRDTKIDGANPTRLLTQTLGQVSAIAGTNIDILDDKDLQERLKLLEWLLLADIPEREIRPDTRAAFAASQIAALAPILVQETDGLTETARLLASLKNRSPNIEQATREEIQTHDDLVAEKTEQLNELVAKHTEREIEHLGRCFGLLLQAFREYPGKPRLFYRLHQFCRVTGYKGLPYIGRWINEQRERERGVWADYYAGLSLQLLSRGTLVAARTLQATDVMRSSKEASVRYLEDVAALDTKAFHVRRNREAWFHAVAKKEFGVVIKSVGKIIRENDKNKHLARRLDGLAKKFANITFEETSQEWEDKTGQFPGVWAHSIENILSIEGKPSPVWQYFEPCFSYKNFTDRRAARRYPEILSNKGWNYLVNSRRIIKESDSGWLREVIQGEPARIRAARSANSRALNRAARSFSSPNKGWITLSEWTEFVSTKCSPFDPRRSEWTALEIVRQIVSPVVNELTVSEERLDRLHPNNILVTEHWKSAFHTDLKWARVSWEEWRNYARGANNIATPIKLRDPATSVIDYRYFTNTQKGSSPVPWERQLAGVGRILLGLLRLNHAAPRLWNLRGNEQVLMLPRAKMFRSLAISSPTLQIVEGCLSGRSAETRAILREPDFFGWLVDVTADDTNFDPPLLRDSNELLEAIENAQGVLKENQLAVAMNQPRQLVPFRLRDFAAGPIGDEEENEFG